AQNGLHLETRNAHTGALIRSFSYDSLKDLTEMTRHAPDESVIERIVIERDFSGLPTMVSVDSDGVGPAGPRQHPTPFNPGGSLLSLTDPVGHSVAWSYSHQNPKLLTGMTDPAGRQKSYAYDDRGRIIEQIDPLTLGQASPGTFRY